MKKKRGKGIIQINFSNRWLYTFVAIFILAAIGVGVYAYGTSNPAIFGHSAGELAAPVGCISGQVLQYNGTGWNCGNSLISSTGLYGWCNLIPRTSGYVLDDCTAYPPSTCQSTSWVLYGNTFTAYNCSCSSGYTRVRLSYNFSSTTTQDYQRLSYFSCYRN